MILAVLRGLIGLALVVTLLPINARAQAVVIPDVASHIEWGDRDSLIDGADAVFELQSTTPTAVRAQDERGRLWGYAFYAPGIAALPSEERMVHLGVGVEWLLRRKFGVGAEIGMIGVGEEGDGGVGGVVSMNGTYYFRDPPPAYNRAIEPFVTAGYTRAPGGGALSASLFNAGAGLNWWSAGGTGLRVEVRHHEYVREIVACSSDPNCRNWFLDFRIGVTFGR